MFQFNKQQKTAKESSKNYYIRSNGSQNRSTKKDILESFAKFSRASFLIKLLAEKFRKIYEETSLPESFSIKW